MSCPILTFLLHFLSLGLSAEYKDYKDYGDSKLFWLSRKTHSVEFIPKDKSNVTVVWKEGDPLISKDRRILKTVLGLQLSGVTQKESGRYIVRDKDQNELATHVLEVKGEDPSLVSICLISYPVTSLLLFSWSFGFNI